MDSNALDFVWTCLFHSQPQISGFCFICGRRVERSKLQVGTISQGKHGLLSIKAHFTKFIEIILDLLNI